MGFNAGHKLFYPREIRFCGDYWISCLNAYYHRMIWRDNRFTFRAIDTFTGKGGQAEFRNMNREEEDYNWLIKMFGSEVIQKKKDTHLAKLRHQFQKTLKLPF